VKMAIGLVGIKGISLSVANWEKLSSLIGNVDELLANSI